MKLDVEDCVLNRMQIGHVYQTATPKVLFDKYELAPLQGIAASLLTYDVSQVECVELRADFVGKVLTQ